jgi:bifunctional non-homologous end joining protein LigD
MGLDCLLKCSGGKGLHVVVPIVPKAGWDSVKAWAAGVAKDMVKDNPDLYVATITKAKRKGKILIDYFRNDYTATSIASYSLRARAGAPVAMPVPWTALPRLKSARAFSMQDALKKLDKAKDSTVAIKRQSLPGVEKWSG